MGVGNELFPLLIFVGIGAMTDEHIQSFYDKMVKAKDLDALDIAADWIGEVADPAHRTELATKYEELKAKFSPAS